MLAFERENVTTYKYIILDVEMSVFVCYGVCVYVWLQHLLNNQAIP